MQFSLASFNLENLGGDAEESLPLSERVSALRPLLERTEADVLCLQEVSAKWQGHEPGPRPGHRTLAALDAVLAGTRYSGFHRLASVHPTTGHLLDIHNLVILSRFPLLASEQVQHDLVPAPQWHVLTAMPRSASPDPVGWDRPILHAQLDIGNGRRLHVLNLHLRAPMPANIVGAKSGSSRWNSTRAFAEGCFLAEVKRAGQALEARFIVDRIFDQDPKALIAVVGDFNAASGEMPMKAIAATTHDTGNAMLDGRALSPIEAAIPKAQRYSLLYGGEPLLLDHILASKSLAEGFRSAEILNEALTDDLLDWLWRRRTAGSHHAPVVARFEI